MKIDIYLSHKKQLYLSPVRKMATTSGQRMFMFSVIQMVVLFVTITFSACNTIRQK